MTMSLEAEAIAEKARAKYEASVETLKSFIRVFPSITQRVEEHDERLGLLETKFMQLKDEISCLIAESKKVPFSSNSSTRRFSKETVSVSIDERVSTSNETKTESKRLSIEREIVSVTIEEQAMSARSSDNKDDTTEQESPPGDSERSVSPARSVSFTDDKAKVWRYSAAELDAIIPVHGHWLPDAVTAHRLSFQNANDFTRQLGGRVVKLQTGIESADPIDCILVEPMGKILSPNEYVATGLMVCLHGSAHEPEVLEEWGEVLKLTKVLDAGMSMALPNLSALAEQEDVEAVLEAVLRQASYDRCILAGKDWGGQMAMEMACGTRVCERVDGVLLVAPTSPVPEAISRLECPVLLLWAENDEESPFSEIRDWYQALQDRNTVSCTKDLSRGGHNFADMLKEGETAQFVLFFIVSALLLNQLCQSLDEASCTGEDVRVSDSAYRLCDELPPFLANQVGGDAEDGVAAALTSRDPARVKRRMHRLIEALRDWISAGLQEMASATE
mmetsp:Transcript_57078/g.99785  ORF Transcript_57078/g.99785 Transcript_57078/m.99785 type:complete len:504 (+) Transcript_57078:171-1682(+)